MSKQAHTTLKGSVDGKLTIRFLEEALDDGQRKPKPASTLVGATVCRGVWRWEM